MHYCQLIRNNHMHLSLLSVLPKLMLHVMIHSVLTLVNVISLQQSISTQVLIPVFGGLIELFAAKHVRFIQIFIMFQQCD